MADKITAAEMPDNTSADELARLLTYGRELVAAGFRVWHSPSGGRGAGYLTYARNGLYGHLQRSDFEGWSHDMPIRPSREHGSSMFIQNPLPVWTVAAAEQAASPTNRNKVVGPHANAGEAHTWHNPGSVEL